MDRLLQTFELPFRDRSGDEYDVHVFGRGRERDTWQGWLVFARRRDGASYTTDIETTQPNVEAVLYWASGLTDPYLDGAFHRARRRALAPSPDVPAIETTYNYRLARIERDVLHAFTDHSTTQLSTAALMRELPYESADVMRALEHLENQRHMLVRRTSGGTDWLILTYGAER